MAMAFAILKGLGAPPDVSAATVDAASGAAESSGCSIRNVRSAGGALEFDRLDDGLPVNFGALAALYFWHIPFPEELNRYRLAVRNLPAGTHSLAVDGRKVGSWSHAQWAAGINLSSATADPWSPGGPWDAQANVVLRLTESRHGLELARMMAALHSPALRDDPAWLRETTELNARIESLQRKAARPATYHFVLRPEAP